MIPALSLYISNTTAFNSKDKKKKKKKLIYTKVDWVDVVLIVVYELFFKKEMIVV
jgi:hypothetical protein